MYLNPLFFILPPFKLMKEDIDSKNLYINVDNICIIKFRKKDPNFEFLSSWNMSDYYDSSGQETPVTELTDERLQELGFPVVPSSPASSVLTRPPQDNVINNPFFTFVSRKYLCPPSSCQFIWQITP